MPEVFHILAKLHNRHDLLNLIVDLLDKAEAILKLLVEGMSVRSIERITQVHRDTILRLLVVAGERCTNLMSEKLQKLSCRRVQCDEIWTFVQKKNRHVRKGESPDFGDQWVFVALDADTKLVSQDVYCETYRPNGG